MVRNNTVVRNNTEKSRVPFTEFPPKATLCKNTLQYNHQDIDIGITKVQNIYIHRDPSCCPDVATGTFLFLPPPAKLNPANHQFVLYFYNFPIPQDCYIN